jgi:hypothetical protein
VVSNAATAQRLYTCGNNEALLRQIFLTLPPIVLRTCADDWGQSLFSEEEDDTPQAPYPCVDRSRLKLSNTYQSSYAATTLHTCKVEDNLLSILTHQTVAMPGDLGLSRP